jgi:hypothetical protein
MGLGFSLNIAGLGSAKADYSTDIIPALKRGAIARSGFMNTRIKSSFIFDMEMKFRNRESYEKAP